MAAVTGSVILMAARMLWVLPIALVISLLGYCIYQIYFHPYAKYPGPWISKFTGVRGAYYAWKGNQYLDMWQCHQKYGPMVRYGPDYLMIDKASAIKDIYGMGKNVQKDRAYGRLSWGTTNLLTTVDKKEHARRRRMVGSVMNEAFLKRFEPCMLGHIRKFCMLLRRNEEPSDSVNVHRPWGPPVVMSEWLSYLTFDIMTDYAFGIDYNLLQNPEKRYIIGDIADSNVRAATILWAPYLYLGRLDKKLFKTAIRAQNRCMKFIKQLLVDCSSHARVENVFTHLTGAKDSQTGTTLTPKEVSSEASVISVGGHDTSATTLCAAVFYLSRNPHAYAKLANEICSSFNSVEEIRLGDQLRSCRYLRACVDETLRMSPAIATCPFREVGPGGEMVDGRLMPAGCHVGVGIYTIHHNAAHFPRPHEFIPERWLVDEDGGYSQEEVSMALAAYFPFSTGPRICVGRSLALAEMLVTIATLMWTYEFRAFRGHGGDLGGGDPSADNVRTNPGEFQLYDHVACGKKGPVIQLRLRH